MGAEESKPAVVSPHDAVKTPPRPIDRTSKLITIIVDGNTVQVRLEDSELTVGWLCSEVLRRWGEEAGDTPIVALKSTTGNETLDAYLLEYSRHLTFLQDGDVLEAVFADYSGPSRTNGGQVTLQDFHFIKTLGKGGFAKVLLVRKKDDGRLYAMKVVRKRHIIRERKVAQIGTELRVLQQVNHPQLLKLHYAFQTEEELFFVLDFCPGGELFLHLRYAGRFKEREAKFYFSQVVLALEYLHQLNIIYRDLKPENIFLDTNGQVKLGDFGLAKELFDGRNTKSFCGSPEYFCPEMILHKPYDKSIDFYSAGALLYELAVGYPPYYCSHRPKMYENILRADLEFPELLNLSEPFKDLVRRLLDRTPSLRLGCGPEERGWEDVKAHPFFVNINWQALASGLYKPPVLPGVRVSNFDHEYTSLPMFDKDPHAHQISLSDLASVPFPGFYKVPSLTVMPQPPPQTIRYPHNAASHALVQSHPLALSPHSLAESSAVMMRGASSDVLAELRAGKAANDVYNFKLSQATLPLSTPLSAHSIAKNSR